MRGPIVITSLILTLAFAAPALAQQADRGGVLAAYNLTNLEAGQDKVDGFQFEADARIADLPLHIAGHFASTQGLKFAGVGPRVEHPWGPIRVFGHYLLGTASLAGTPSDGIDWKGGGGVNVPFANGRGLVRIGVDHDGTVSYSTVGVGWRF